MGVSLSYWALKTQMRFNAGTQSLIVFEAQKCQGPAELRSSPADLVAASQQTLYKASEMRRLQSKQNEVFGRSPQTKSETKSHRGYEVCPVAAFQTLYTGSVVMRPQGQGDERSSAGPWHFLASETLRLCIKRIWGFSAQ